MTEATKRPWGYVHHKGLDQHLVGATLENVAIVEDRHGNAKENAEFIVKAVNSHDALVAAIGKMCSITSCFNNADTWITRTISLLGERLSATMPVCERHLDGERP